MPERAHGYGVWNGVVSFQTVSNYGKVMSQDSRSYIVHTRAGSASLMSGSGKLLVTDHNSCGATTDGWGWTVGGAKVPSTAVSITDDGI